jgi:Family of unknown function (DUF6327)
MGTKKYSSYAEIEKDLEILKVEREIHYQKMLLSVDKTKESIVPSKALSIAGTIYDTALSGTTGTIIKIATPFVLNTAVPFIKNWFNKRKKRDD